LHEQTDEDLEILFAKENRVLAACLFGSYARGSQTAESDIDVTVLLSDVPEKMLECYLHFVDELSQVLGNEVDLIIFNAAPPLFRYQTIKHGKLVYCRDEKARIEFEARLRMNI